MRLSREELITQYPSWNEERHDIVKALYGDIPVKSWDKEYHDKYSKLTGTLSNIEGVEAYMWSANGDYDIYTPLIGEVYISKEDQVMAGRLTVKYRGVAYNIYLNMMYGRRALCILKLSGAKVGGFSNKDGMGSPCNFRNTVELEPDVVKRVLNTDLSDYGSSVKKFIEVCKSLYYEDAKNYIMQKTFSA